MTDIESTPGVEERPWVLMKRDLFYRPESCCYTGIRDHAGRYTDAEAKSAVGAGDSGVTAHLLRTAPEFSKGCWDDIARAHLAKQRDDAYSALVTAIIEIDEAADKMFVLGRNHHGEHVGSEANDTYRRMMGEDKAFMLALAGRFSAAAANAKAFLSFARGGSHD